MTCKHENTTVTNSRPCGARNANGKIWYGPKPYPFLIGRRRKCLDCGHRFTTVEVTTETMDGITATIWQAVLKDVKEGIERMYRAATAKMEVNVPEAAESEVE